MSQAVRYVEDIRDICLSLVNGTRGGQSVDYIRQGYSRIKVGSHFIFFRQSPT
jgi:plasmid stabilization system protein ParE